MRRRQRSSPIHPSPPSQPPAPPDLEPLRSAVQALVAERGVSPLADVDRITDALLQRNGPAWSLLPSPRHGCSGYLAPQIKAAVDAFLANRSRGKSAIQPPLGVYGDPLRNAADDDGCDSDRPPKKPREDASPFPPPPSSSPFPSLSPSFTFPSPSPSPLFLPPPLPPPPPPMPSSNLSPGLHRLDSEGGRPRRQ